MTTLGHTASASALPSLTQVLLEHVTDGVIVLDAAGQVLLVNASARRQLGPAAADGDWDGAALRRQALRLGGRAIPVAVAEHADLDVIVVAASHGGTLAERERRAILDALGSANGGLAETARLLGISRTTLWRRLKAYGLHRAPRPNGQRR